MKRNTENFTTTTTTTLCQFGPPAVMNRRQKPRLNEHPDPYGEKGDRERDGIRDNRPAVLKKEAVTLAKQRCTTSSSVLYQRIHGNGAFLPSKKKKKNCHCLRRFAFEDREWEASRGGGRPHANDANANLQAKTNIFFFSVHGGGGLSCAPSSPTCSPPMCPWHDLIHAGWQPPPPSSRCFTARVCVRVNES